MKLWKKKIPWPQDLYNHRKNKEGEGIIRGIINIEFLAT